MKLRLFGILTFAVLTGTLPAAVPAKAQINISVTAFLAPPPLPIYVQPPIPTEGYLWAPGYWAWDGLDYYWVSGAWVQPPSVGLLWTPGYWAWRDGFYAYNAGYWGRHVGFYGGVVYGFGYTGFGYEGGYWNNGAFFYNRYVNNVTNVTIINVYNKTVIVNTNANTVSYNGGKGGITAAPTPEQLVAAREAHVMPTANQLALVHLAHNNRQAFAKVNNGKPPVAVVAPLSKLAPVSKAKVFQTPSIQAQQPLAWPAKITNLAIVGRKQPVQTMIAPQFKAPLKAQQPKLRMQAPQRRMQMIQPKPQVMKPHRPAASRPPPRGPRCRPNARCR